jgi:hypothetical protein
MWDGDKSVYPRISKKFASTNYRKSIINKLTNHQKKINDSILEEKWPKNNLNVRDYPYDTLVFTYSRKMDQLWMACQ